MPDDAHLIGTRLAHIISLDHLSREFEKVHAALPVLTTRVAVVESWIVKHPDTHRLEGVALALAREATDGRLHSMNELRQQIDRERGTYITCELYDREHQRLQADIASLRSSRDTSTGEKSALERFWPLLLSAALLALAIIEAAKHWQ